MNVEEPKVNELYREVILDHYRNPRNKGKLENPDVSWEGKNPLCGDEVEITLKLDGGRIMDIKSLGRGCSISQASGSMMTELVLGRSIEDVRKTIEAFKGMMLKGVPCPEELDDLRALEGVKHYPVRIKCALLAWDTLELALEQAAQKKKVTVDDLKEALKQVTDPEIGISIMELGLIYGIELDDKKCRIKMTLTGPGCPAGGQILAAVHHVARMTTGLEDVHVDLVWDPPWDPKTMASDEVKFMLGLL